MTVWQSRQSNRTEELLQTLLRLSNDELLELGLNADHAKDIETVSYVYDRFLSYEEADHADVLRVETKSLIGVEPIPFLAQAQELTQLYVPYKTGPCSVYVILLDDVGNKRQGLYVGQTCHYIQQRFQDHLDGAFTAAWCHWKMFYLLPTLYAHLTQVSKDE
jgi:hypothetical protein